MVLCTSAHPVVLAAEPSLWPSPVGQMIPPYLAVQGVDPPGVLLAEGDVVDLVRDVEGGGLRGDELMCVCI